MNKVIQSEGREREGEKRGEKREGEGRVWARKTSEHSSALYDIQTCPLYKEGENTVQERWRGGERERGKERDSE